MPFTNKCCRGQNDPWGTIMTEDVWTERSLSHTCRGRTDAGAIRATVNVTFRYTHPSHQRTLPGQMKPHTSPAPLNSAAAIKVHSCALKNGWNHKRELLSHLTSVYLWRLDRGCIIIPLLPMSLYYSFPFHEYCPGMQGNRKHIYL